MRDSDSGDSNQRFTRVTRIATVTAARMRGPPGLGPDGESSQPESTSEYRSAETRPGPASGSESAGLLARIRSHSEPVAPNPSRSVRVTSFGFIFGILRVPGRPGQSQTAEQVARAFIAGANAGIGLSAYVK